MNRKTAQEKTPYLTQVQKKSDQANPSTGSGSQIQQQPQNKVSKQTSLPLDDNGIEPQGQKLPPQLLSAINDQIQNLVSKIQDLERDNKKQKEYNKEIETKVAMAEIDVKNLKENYQAIQIKLYQREDEIKKLQQQSTAKPQSESEDSKLDQAKIIDMVTKACQNSEKVSNNFEQQQNQINQISNENKIILENNQNFKEQIFSEINKFHSNLNQSLVTATEDMKNQLNAIGTHVQKQQNDIFASQQQFAQWLSLLQNATNNQQTPNQQPYYNAQQPPQQGYQQPQNYGYPNDYQQGQPSIAQTQVQYSQSQIQQPPTSTLSESTRSKIKIVSSNTVPVQQH